MPVLDEPVLVAVVLAEPDHEHCVVHPAIVVLPRQGSLLTEDAPAVVAEALGYLEAHSEGAVVVDIAPHGLLIGGPIEASDILVIPGPGLRLGLGRTLHLP